MVRSPLKTASLILAVVCLAVFIMTLVSHRPSLEKRPFLMPKGLYFLWMQTVYDPILALPGADTGELQASAEALQKSTDTYLEAYTMSEQNLISSSLHPFEFLDSLASLENSRREFIEGPSYGRAVRYQLSLMRSLGLMREYSGRLSDIVYELPISHGASMPAGVTSKLHLANTLAGVYSNADGQIKEVWRRTKCAVWHGDYCELQHPPMSVSPAVPVDTERKTDEGYAEALKEFFFGPIPFSPLSLTKTAPDQLPLVLVPEPACTRAQEATYLFMWSRSRTSGREAFLATPVNEILFHETTNSTDAFGQNLADSGVQYAYQTMSPYLCTDYGLDAGAVRTAYFLSQKLKSPVLGRYADEDLPAAFRPLKGLENSIAESDEVIHISLIESYIRDLQAALYDPDTDIGPITEPDRRRLFELIALWRSKSGWLESEISRIDDMAMTSRYVLRVTGIPIEALFIYRSYYSTLLLAGNETVHESPLRFIEQKAASSDPLGDMVIYQNGLEKTIPLSELGDLLLQEGKRSEDVYTIDDFRYE